MSEVLQLAANANLDAFAASAFALEPVPPHERKGLLRDEAALLVDRLLVRVARGRGALDLAIGESLAAISVGDRTLRLGFSCLGDYSRERLGLAGSTAEKLVRLVRALHDRPLLREAVRAGLVTARKAETILPVARGEDEARWVALARVETVRALAAAVKAIVAVEPDRDEAMERVVLACGPEVRAKLDESLALAGRQLGATAPRWQRLEALCEEYLGAHPAELPEEESDDGASSLLDRTPTGAALEEGKDWLEAETERWAFLDSVEPVPVSDGDAPGPLVDLTALDGRLRRLARLRDRWDEVFGHLALLLRQLGLWRDLRFASFGHYCAERLGLSENAVRQRASLERRLHELPALRAALRDGRVTYEKARIVAAAAADASDLDGLIARAERLPCIALAREAEAAEEAQTCARGEVAFRLPSRVASLLDAAFRAAQRTAGRPLTPSQCLERIADHFIATWKPLLAERNTVQKRVLARDRGCCQVPGCSRAALQVHHVTFRSHGGGDEPENLVGLCAAHHLHAVHIGWVRVVGEAPSRLRWSFRAGGGPALCGAAVPQPPRSLTAPPR